MKNCIDVRDYGAFKQRDSRSPFRYPGGKAFLAGYLKSRLSSVSEEGRQYAEPYCGGAGAALLLLAAKEVSDIHINDADKRIYSAWYAMLFENQRFLDRLSKVQVTVETWREAQQVVAAGANSSYSFELGFSTFFLNRTSRAGIIDGSGPIGGYKQESDWKIGARFYRDSLTERVRWIGRHAEHIHLTNLDGLDFLKQLQQTPQIGQTLVFVDPPYVTAGRRLYFNGMTPEKHAELASYLTQGSIPHWVLTYDDSPIIRDHYASADISKMEVQYSLQRPRKEPELIISGRNS